MSEWSPKDRLLRTLSREKVDRPPVVCPGGMMNAAIVDVMAATGNTLPEGHHDASRMAALAGDVHASTGFENLGVPFCMTVEAEVLGSAIDFGTLACEPKIAQERFEMISGATFGEPGELARSGRIGTVVEATARLAASHADVPVIGNLTGPLSTAASVVVPLAFLKSLRKERDLAHAALDAITDFLVAYARRLVEAGATVVSIGDPTATGEILGPAMFDEYAVRYLNRLVDGIHDAGVPAIVHICGRIEPVRHMIPRLRADAISTDALVNLRQLKADYPQLTVMGNISTYLLEADRGDRAARQAGKLVRDGIDIISPACGLSTSTSVTTLRAMTDAVRKSG